MNPQPRVVILEEARQTQYNTYISELQSRTGLSWNGIFLSHCPPGRWNGIWCTGSEDEGVAVLSSLPVQSTDSMYFPYGDSWHSARAAVRAAVNVNGVTLQVFGVHLIPNDAQARYNSMSLLRNWASNQSRPQIVGGDFNADPDQIRSSQGMGSAFIDSTLVVGSGNSLTALLPSLTMKLDYLFSDSGNRAQPQWAVVVNTGSVSDHLPVLASYTVVP
jgi:endonuclease/exonuclease/phosphatase family metal-dependent hydrolase